jgi:hypothetical protein
LNAEKRQIISDNFQTLSEKYPRLKTILKGIYDIPKISDREKAVRECFEKNEEFFIFVQELRQIGQ